MHLLMRWNGSRYYGNYESIQIQDFKSGDYDG